MKAAETKVDRLLASSETAFAIPVYQCDYDWPRVQCQLLSSDTLVSAQRTWLGIYDI